MKREPYASDTERRIELNPFARVERWDAGMSDALRREERRDGADTIANTELTIEHRHHVVRAPRGLQEGFNDPRGGGTEGVRAGRPQPRDARFDATQLHLR